MAMSYPMFIAGLGFGLIFWPVFYKLGERSWDKLTQTSRCACKCTGAVCEKFWPEDTSAILPRCWCGHDKECHDEHK